MWRDLKEGEDRAVQLWDRPIPYLQNPMRIIELVIHETEWLVQLSGSELASEIRRRDERGA
jgi:hypothetical protein